MREFKSGLQYQVYGEALISFEANSNWKRLLLNSMESHALKCSMKDILYELVTTYKLTNPIRGIAPGYPYKTHVETEQSDDRIDKKIETDYGEWQKHASKYARERIFRHSL